MPRKFLYSMHALVENYATNQVTHLLYSGGVWTPFENITAGPTSNNLSSLAANTQGSRVLYANYTSGAVVPLNYAGGTWTTGTPVGQGGGNCAAVTMSGDGLHALSSGDFATAVTPYEYNTSTGLWVAGSSISLASTHFNTVQMSRDGLRAVAVPKYDDSAFPLFRNPSTGIWSAAAGIGLNAGSERYFAAGFSPDGNAVFIGSNTNSVPSDGLTWNGSSWDRVSIPVTLLSATWRPDGLSLIGGYEDTIRVIDYDPVSRTFTPGQSLTGFNNISAVVVANDGIGDTALASDYASGTVIPLTYSRTTQLWTAGSPIVSAFFDHPWNSLVFPVW
jgi:hypothetical protein